MIKFDHIGFRIKDNIILDDVSLEILPGEFVCIVGESGAGKSTLFRLFIGEEKATSGKILVNNVSLSDLSLSGIQQYRRKIGVVFQDFRLITQRTVFENLTFALEVCGKEELIEKQIPKLLKLVGLSGKEDQFPYSLSGGEKQRLAIARALIHNPQILVADEPTGNLDLKNAKEIALLFKKLHKENGLTVLCATHDPRFVEQVSPRIIKVDNGKIVLDKKKVSLKEVF